MKAQSIEGWKNKYCTDSTPSLAHTLICIDELFVRKVKDGFTDNYYTPENLSNEYEAVEQLLIERGYYE